MKQNEKKINIDVNIHGTRFSVTVPFQDQHAVRTIETEMKAYLTQLRDKHPTKHIAECMAMMAFHYARQSFALKTQLEADMAEAEDLLRSASNLCGDPSEEGNPDAGMPEYGDF